MCLRLITRDKMNVLEESHVLIECYWMENKQFNSVARTSAYSFPYPTTVACEESEEEIRLLSV